MAHCSTTAPSLSAAPRATPSHVRCAKHVGLSNSARLTRCIVRASPKSSIARSSKSGEAGSSAQNQAATEQITRQAEPQTPEKDLGVGLKAAWFGAELFGDLLSAIQPSSKQQQEPDQAQLLQRENDDRPATRSVADVLASIKEDYAVEYFISGRGEMAAYDPQCLFKDDFAAFRGVDRFKKNVSNLGALTSDVDLAITKWEECSDRIIAHWRFSAILELPWRPRLAAAGSTTHVIDTQRGLVVEHIEAWKSDPKEVVARLLRPAAKVPSTPWEAFMANLSSGDAKGCWYVINKQAALIATPLVGASLLLHAATGHGLPGGAGAAVEVLSGVLLVAGLLTEAWKYVEGTGEI